MPLLQTIGGVGDLQQTGSAIGGLNCEQDYYFNRRTMKFSFLSICIALTVFTSCEKEYPVNPCDCYIITEFTFGHFYGECGGEGCVEIFRVDLDQQKLFEDVNDFYPRTDTLYQGNFEMELSDDKYQQVKDLLAFVPSDLYIETQTVLGQPDAGDWGGIYFEMEMADGRKFWLLDQMDNNMPQAYNEFVDKINEKISVIHE